MSGTGASARGAGGEGRISKPGFVRGNEAFIKRRPLLTYFVLTFVISWGAILIVMALAGIPADQEELDRFLPVAILAMLGGPSVAGLLLTGLVSGKAGFRDLLSRLFRWRVGVGWYVVALLTAPLLIAVVAFPLSLLSLAFRPSIVASDAIVPLLIMGIVAGVMAGIFEELGWTGFAVPRLRLRYSVLATGVFVGVLWGAWHILSNDIWAGAVISGDLSVAFVVILRAVGFLVGPLVAFRVLMVWVYDRTGGSLLVAMLMHASLTASTLILGPLAISGASLLVYDLVSTVAAWVLVGALAVAARRQLTRRPAANATAAANAVLSETDKAA